MQVSGLGNQQKLCVFNMRSFCDILMSILKKASSALPKMNKMESPTIENLVPGTLKCYVNPPKHF